MTAIIILITLIIGIVIGYCGNDLIRVIFIYFMKRKMYSFNDITLSRDSTISQLFEKSEHKLTRGNVTSIVVEIIDEDDRFVAKELIK